MGTDRDFRRLDAAAAERLLAGDDAGFDDLGGLLSAAAAPPRAHELAGETAALVAFRYANLEPAGRPQRRSAARPMWARLAGIKIAAIAVALATAGVALAATTGVLPNPFKADSPTAAPEPSSIGPMVTSARTLPVTTGPSHGGGPASAPATPSPSLAGLCRSYRTAVKDNAGKVLDNPAFAALITAAGGKSKVDSFCADLLGEKSDKPTQQPGNTDHPTGPPTTPPGQSTRTPHN